MFFEALEPRLSALAASAALARCVWSGSHQGPWGREPGDEDQKKVIFHIYNVYNIYIYNVYNI
jgi:hypothetical protein